MINKKLLSFDRGALRYVELNVLFQWLGMLCNVVFVKAVAGLIGAAFAGSLTSALLHDTPIYLFDEPTSNLDSLNEGVILKAVRAECKDKTVLLVSHRKSTMAAADISFSVESGRLS